MINGPGRKDNEKIRLHIVPAHTAKTANLSKYRLLIDFKFKPVTQTEIEPLRIILLNRNIARSGLSPTTDLL